VEIYAAVRRFVFVEGKSRREAARVLPGYEFQNVPLFGVKREEKQSLGTRDPNEAKRVHARALAELGERWANLRSGTRVLSEREATNSSPQPTSGGSTRIAIIPATRKSGNRSISASSGTIMTPRSVRICPSLSETGEWRGTGSST
jgi:hypothetical protein